MIQWFDVVLFFILAAVFPVLTRRGRHRVLQLLAAGVPGVRPGIYRMNIAVDWGLVALLIPLWLTAGRTASDLGLSLAGGWRLWLGLAAAAIAAGFLLRQARGFPGRPDDWKTVHQQVKSLEFMMPHDDRELAAFSWLSVTAGICEEILYRGHLMWLLTAFSGSWVAFFGSSLVFALGHSYQGLQGMVRVFAVGLVMAALYLFTGSLWAPILLHIMIDLTSGRMVYTVLSGRRATEMATAAA